MASELLSTIQGEIDARLNELRPLLAEYEQLLVAADALLDSDGDNASAAPAPKKLPATRAKRAPRGSAAGVIARAAAASPASTKQTVPAVAEPAPEIPEPRAKAPKPKAKSEIAKPERAPRGAAREAILAALDHGSHTVGELVVVTAMSAPNLNGNLRRLTLDGAVVKTEREGKTAYALPTSA